MNVSTHSSPLPPAQFKSWACVEEMRGWMQGLGLDLQPLQLGGGSFAGGLLSLEIAPLRLMRFQVGGSGHCLGQKPNQVLAVSIDLDPCASSAPWLSHGEALPHDCLFGQSAQREIHFTVPASISLGMIFFPVLSLRHWAQDLGWPGFAGELLPSCNVHQMHRPAAEDLRRYLRWLFALAERSPVRLRRPAIQRLVREDLIPLLLDALITGPAQTQRAIRPPPRIAIVKDVQGWLRAHPTLPITLADLCREAHASRRTLIQGFREHLGMGPMAYVKLVRLHGIRRQLLRADPGEIQIGALADASGFHNAGHFAADYRRLFGEAPKDTLRRSRLRQF